LQARFALSSSAVFTRSDTVTDSERFYNSILDLLEDRDEVKEVDDLLAWWNRLVIPVHLFLLIFLMISVKSFPIMLNHPVLCPEIALWPKSRPRGQR
jgi:hypothetical protein